MKVKPVSDAFVRIVETDLDPIARLERAGRNGASAQTGKRRRRCGRAHAGTQDLRRGRPLRRSRRASRDKTPAAYRRAAEWKLPKTERIARESIVLARLLQHTVTVKRQAGGGHGNRAQREETFAPFTKPAGTSASVKFGPAVPEPAVPQGPDEPSTCTQSETLPRDGLQQRQSNRSWPRSGRICGPSTGRAARSANRPITLDSGMGATSGDQRRWRCAPRGLTTSARLRYAQWHGARRNGPGLGELVVAGAGEGDRIISRGCGVGGGHKLHHTDCRR